METYDDILRSFNDTCATAKKMEEECDKELHAEIKKLKAAYAKKKAKLQPGYPNWIDDLVRPLAAALSEHTGMTSEVASPHGSVSYATITLITDSGQTASLEVFAFGDASNYIRLGYLVPAGSISSKYTRERLPDTVEEIAELFQIP